MLTTKGRYLRGSHGTVLSVWTQVWAADGIIVALWQFVEWLTCGVHSAECWWTASHWCSRTLEVCTAETEQVSFCCKSCLYNVLREGRAQWDKIIVSVVDRHSVQILVWLVNHHSSTDKCSAIIQSVRVAQTGGVYLVIHSNHHNFSEDIHRQELGQ